MIRDPMSTTLETYKLNMSIFEKGQLEDFLGILANFNTSIDKTVTTTAVGRINYLGMMLHG